MYWVEEWVQNGSECARVQGKDAHNKAVEEAKERVGQGSEDFYR